MANITVHKVVTVAFLAFLLSVSCSRKEDGDMSASYSEAQIHDMQRRFDSCEAVVSSYKKRDINMGNVDSVLATVNELLDFPVEILTPEQIGQQARHYLIASSLYTIKNEVDSAFSVLEKGMSFYGDKSYKNAYFDVSTAMTILFFNYAMYDQAEKYADLAINAAKSLNDSARRCVAYANKSWVADKVRGGDKGKAFHYVQLARKWRPAGNLFLYYLLESYAGHIYVTASETDSVATGLRRLLEFDECYSAQFKDAEGIAYLPYNIGRGYAALGKDDKACRYFDRALKEAENEPDMIKGEILSGIVEYYASHDMADMAMKIIPEWVRLNTLRNKVVSEQNMAYWDSRFNNVKMEYELQVTRNNLLQRTIQNSILILLVIFSVLAIIVMVYRVIRYKRKVSELYADLQCSHARWMQLTSPHTISVNPEKHQEADEGTINLEEEGSDEKQHMKKIYDRVKTVMKKDKPFLSPQFDLPELALMVYCNRSQLSAAINRFYGTNFSNFVSEYRVNYFIDMLNGSDVRIEEMWPKAGFPSRSSFYRQFHAVTKLTPAQYLEQKLKQVKNKQ